MIFVFFGSDIILEIKGEDGVDYVVDRRCCFNVDVLYILKKVSYCVKFIIK